MLEMKKNYVKQVDDIADVIAIEGEKLEEDPTAWGTLFDQELLRALTLMEVPEPYNPMPNCNGLFGKDPVDYSIQIFLAERVSRYDAGVILAMPTPSMPGHAVNVLGNDAQKEAFFGRFLQRPKRSFFAVTEPQVGSDATAGTSRIYTENGRLLLGAHKKLVGGGAQADYGLIFVQNADQNNAHKLVICDAHRIGDLDIKRLPMHGLAAADLSEIIAENVEINPKDILGHGVPVGLRDGFFAMNRVFERYRPIVCAQAIGNARGILDMMKRIGVSDHLIQPYLIRHKVFLARLDQIANTYLSSGLTQHETSYLKHDAINFSNDVVQAAVRYIPSTDLFQTPRLLKKLRDAKGYEYMEGTSNIHLIQSFPNFAAKRG